jgi:hypothetical protein
MTNLCKETFIKNLSYASGGHGLNEQRLTENLKCLVDVDEFIYTISKALELNSNFWLNSTIDITEKFEEKWSKWHNIFEKYSESWGFKKKQTGCYVYALFDSGVPDEVDFLCDNVFYIGQSRSITRDAMLGRRNDFISTVKNNPLVAHSCGKSFLQHFGQEKMNYVYQAYLPLPAYFCVDRETDLLISYFQKFNNLPKCNHKDDLVRIMKIIKNRGTL